MNKFFKKISLLIILLVSFIGISINAEIIELPNSNQVPKMITMSIYGDAETQMAFNYNTVWETQTVLQVVEYGEGFESSNIKEFIGTHEKSQILNDGYIHRVLATGLTKSTKYQYRLGDKELNIWSDVGSFSTAGDTNGVKFVHISDPQGYEKMHYENYNELLNVAYKTCNPDLFMLAGDVVNDSYVDATPKLEQWHWALTDQKDILQNIPLMCASGNHDASINDFYSRFNYLIPENSNTTTGVYYSFNYQGVHFVVLNTNDTINDANNVRGLSDDQINWLKADLKNANTTFTIVMMHKGIYDAGGHCSNYEGADHDIAQIRKQLTPIFSEYGVDLVLQGHDHLYSQSYPIFGKMENELIISADKNGTIIKQDYEGLSYDLYENPIGTIYLNSGTASGSKYYSVVDYDEEKIPLKEAESGEVRMFTEVEIVNNNLYVTVYKYSKGKLEVHKSFGITINSNVDAPTPTVPIEEPNRTWIYIVIGSVVLVGGITTAVILILRKRGGRNEKHCAKECQ